MKAFIKLIAAMAVVLCLSGCSQEENSINDYKPIALAAPQQKIAKKTNDFGFNAFNTAVSLADESENVMLSPLGLAINLSMIANASSGETRQELIDVMGYGENIEELNDYNRTLLTVLPSIDKETTVAIPNSFWYSHTGVTSEFLTVLDDVYDATVQKIAFGKAADAINKWISMSTQGKIPQMLSEDEIRESVFAFVNALYFEAKWSMKFPNKPIKKAFHNCDGTSSSMDFLNIEMQVPYIGNEIYSGIILNYGNGAYSMTIILPDEGYTYADVLNQISVQGLPIEGPQAFIGVSFPEFSLASNIDLMPTLTTMGISRIFDEDKADFSGICVEDTPISLFKQSNKIIVDKDGTTVASATVSSGSLIANSPGKYFIVDRPFLFFIRENSTGAILEAGRIQKF